MEMKGVFVAQVMPNSPAAKAGVQVGDVITEIEGQSVTESDQVQDVVSKSKIGQALQLQVQRGQQKEQIVVRPAELQKANHSSE
jgi:S1-C subfamily serine protease